MPVSPKHEQPQESDSSDGDGPARAGDSGSGDEDNVDWDNESVNIQPGRPIQPKQPISSPDSTHENPPPTTGNTKNALPLQGSSGVSDVERVRRQRSQTSETQGREASKRGDEPTIDHAQYSSFCTS